MTTTNKQPSIEIVFKQLAASAVRRGGRGKVGLIIFDNTSEFGQKTYKLSSEVDADKSNYTIDNFNAIKDCFVGIPAQVTVFVVGEEESISDALNVIKNQKLNWIGTNSTNIADQTAVAQFVKEQEALKKTIKAVVFKPSAIADCKHVVELINENVTFLDERGEQDTFAYIPSVLGVLAGLSLNRSATFLQLNNLAKVKDVEDIDLEISKGKLVMFNDEDVVKFSTAVNSLVTIDANNPLIMTKIENIETMDLIYDDIYTTFKNDYVGKGKNTTDRQFLLISAINTYLKELGLEELLDRDHENKAMVDVVAQRLAWKAVKGDIVDTWTDEEVVNTPFRGSIFLDGDIKLNESIENLKFGITLF